MTHKLVLKPAGKDAKRVLRDGEIIGLVLRLANDRWGAYDIDERRLSPRSYDKPKAALAAYQTETTWGG